MKIDYDGGTVAGVMRGRPARVGVLLAHGAGAGQDHPWMTTVADGLVDAGLSVLTVYYGYPLVAIGKGEPRPTDHLARIRAAQLFFAGTRDRLGPPKLIEKVASGLPEAEVIVVDDGDHSFKVPKRAGKANEEVLVEIVAATAEWMDGSIR